MKEIVLAGSAGLDGLNGVEREDPGAPGPGQVRVAIHGSSLNYNDYTIAAGIEPTSAGRVPGVDGAGVIEAVGEGVVEFSRGDRGVSTFFPDWIAGQPSGVNLANSREKVARFRLPRSCPGRCCCRA